jgi:3',5'-cyclic-AMP phosphodiesterase
MPIHLGPITRRNFLAGAAGTTAALLLGGRTGTAENAKIDPHCFALLSDTHVPSDPKKVQGGVNMTANFTKAIAQVTGLETAPSGAIFCGDISHVAGLKTDYRQFAPIVGKLTEAKLPVHLMLGNHDHIGNLYSVLAKTKPAKPPVVGKHVSIVQSEHANWFLLDSLDVVNSPPGNLGKEQLEWLGKALDAHTDKPAIVMAHHDPDLTPPPPPNSKRKPRKSSGLKDGAALLELLTARKHVKAFINGHRHRYVQRTYKNLHVIGLPTTAYTGAPEKSAWVLARLEKAGIEFELRTLNAKNANNGKKVKLTWR